MKFIAVFLILLTLGLTIFLITRPKPVAELSVTPTPTSTTSGQASVAGTITGKLCFPSEFLPAGAIEVKNVTTNSVSLIEPYAGTEGGAGPEYSISLVAGTYILRYTAKPSASDEPLYGYHTLTCPTGTETSCAAQNPREHIKVEVQPGGTVENIDLCDFYYDASSSPEF